MKWTEITVNTTRDDADLVSDCFFSIGCNGGVKIVDSSDVLEVVNNTDMSDLIDPALLKQSNVVKVSGFVSLEQTNDKQAELKERLDGYGLKTGEITTSVINDEDWYETWKKYYVPIKAGKYVIVPKWIKYASEKGFTPIIMDPGMAFGTGEHESTQLCLRLMSEIDFDGKNVIDVGTGSGILGIGAIKSNAKSCYMCDIDSVAVTAAEENCRLNHVENDVTVELADLLTKRDTVGDVILANLTAGILIRLCDGLTKHISKNGIIICSGIIHIRKQEVIDAFTNVGFTLVEMRTLNEWDALKFRFNG